MKKVIVVLFCSILLGGCSLAPKKAGIEIMTNNPAKVYLDGKEAGSTPYKNTSLKPGEMEVKLKSTNGEWSRKLNLFNYTNTVIDWDFGESEDESGGYVVTMERTGNTEKSGFIVNVNPDKSAIAIDNEIKGFAPTRIDDIGEGDKQVTISFPGYKSLNLFVKGIKDYQLIVNAKLATEKMKTEPLPEPEPTTAEISNQDEVIIQTTETGWLRVRKEANSAATEIAKVKPGEKYPVLTREKDWIKIDLGSGISGWVSERYAKKAEE